MYARDRQRPPWDAAKDEDDRSPWEDEAEDLARAPWYVAKEECEARRGMLNWMKRIARSVYFFPFTAPPSYGNMDVSFVQ